MKDQTAGLLYIPEPERPRDFDQRLKQIVGESPVGEPWVRFVWGMDRKKWYGGKEDQVYFDPHGKYIGLEGHVMEGWTAPEVYDPQEWEERRWGMFNGQFKRNFFTGQLEPQLDPTVDVLGEYPRKGVWDFVRTCFRDDRSLMSYDDMLDLARKWKENNESTNPRQRMIDDYMRHNDGIAARRKAAFEEAKSDNLDYMAKELDDFAKRADYNKFNFSTEGARVRSKNFTGGKAVTESGLVVPRSAIDQ